MHIECFDYFHKVAMAKSISRVASSTHISQPALSQQLQKLEESLGYGLLIRSNKGVELTEKGKIVLKYADNIVRTYEAMIEHLKEDSKNNQTIKIEACWPIATYALPCVLYKIKKKFPYHNYELISNSFEVIEENIRNNIANIGVIYGKPSNKSLEYYEIGSDNLSLVAAYDYDIDDEVNFKDLLKHPFVLLHDKLNVEEAIIERIKEFGYTSNELNILYKSDSTESVKSSIFKGYGIAFLPYISVKKELYEKRLKLIEILDFSIQYNMYLINEKNSQLSEPVSEFIHYFKKIGKENLC
ncbi:LysR family transcriptional regulator [Clostridium sp. D2Q-14]|uniref:LysR family transcriptional regulator n=1 Tax=Anaeromonas gelatinilytica TaxID=2683194 RepID=UPI00193BA4F7|nr:LysR family transcriptional regulator [Anaeromonas gelatinilytica]MBS4534151.1 LysR family transcriptional regulator [Anaeromonas gelatinilytica]